MTGGLLARMFGHTHTIEASKHTQLGNFLLIVADELIPAPRKEQVHAPAEK